MQLDRITALRMERQHLTRPADEAEYCALYRDLQPGQNVYWNGFGQPPTLSFRAAFDDLEYNRERLAARKLIKGRFGGGGEKAGRSSAPGGVHKGAAGEKDKVSQI